MGNTKQRINKIGKYLLILGIIFLLLSFMEVWGVFYLDMVLPFLLIGWFLVILGAIFISLRAAAWTFFLMAFYLMSIFYEALKDSDLDIYVGPFLALILIIHILLGLILGIISFRQNKKRVTHKQKQNRE